MHTFKIYKIVNTVNDMLYIGATIDPRNRWTIHRSEAQRFQHRPLYRAMSEYGIDKFSMQIIEEWDDIYTLFDREQYWIDYFGCMQPKGYNAARARKRRS